MEAGYYQDAQVGFVVLINSGGGSQQHSAAWWVAHRLLSERGP